MKSIYITVQWAENTSAFKVRRVFTTRKAAQEFAHAHEREGTRIGVYERALERKYKKNERL